MTTRQKAKHRPGTVLMTAGLAIAVLAVVVPLLRVMSGTEFVGSTIGWVAIGLVVAAIGFCRRLLAAVERD
jgi:hypothetical protein